MKKGGIQSMDDIAFFEQHNRLPKLLEARRGVDVVSWYGRIEQQMVDLSDEYEKFKRTNEAQKVQTFLQTWRDHRLTGAVNVEDVDALEAAASQLAVDDWKGAKYFMSLRNSLRQLQAGEQELPRVPAEAQSNKPPGGSSRGPVGRFGPSASDETGAEVKPGEEELKPTEDGAVPGQPNQPAQPNEPQRPI